MDRSNPFDLIISFQLTYENALNLFDPNELPDILPYEK